MKIAVLLRGQPRFPEEGAFLFDLFMRNRFPEIEFKLFGHAWTTNSVRMSGISSDDKAADREVSKWLTPDQVATMLAKWNMESFAIQDETECFKTACDILKERMYNEDSTAEWFFKYIAEQKIDSDQLHEGRFMLIPEGHDMNRLLKAGSMIYKDNGELEEMIRKKQFEQMRLNYLLGQMYSAGKAFHVLDDYCTASSWKPDLILLARYDGFNWVHKFDTLLREVKSAAKSGHTIYTRRLTVNDTVPVVDDFMFVGDYMSMQKFISDPKKRLFNAFAQPPFKLFNIIGSGTKLQHLLWTKIADSDLNITQPSVTMWDSGVLRPGYFNLTQAEPTFAFFRDLVKQSSKYVYPDVSKPMSVEETDSEWRRLNGE